MDPESDIYERRMAEFHKTCRLKGIRLTPQRLEVFSALARTSEHPSAETIHRQVVKRLPTITLDTVYRTLGTLEKEGLAVRVSVVGNTQRFEANPECHHHFICRECSRIIDIHSERLDHLSLEKGIPEGFSVDWAQIELRGLCAKCQKSSVAGKSARGRKCAAR